MIWSEGIGRAAPARGPETAVQTGEIANHDEKGDSHSVQRILAVFLRFVGGNRSASPQYRHTYGSPGRDRRGGWLLAHHHVPDLDPDPRGARGDGSSVNEETGMMTGVVIPVSSSI